MEDCKMPRTGRGRLGISSDQAPGQDISYGGEHGAAARSPCPQYLDERPGRVPTNCPGIFAALRTLPISELPLQGGAWLAFSCSTLAVCFIARGQMRIFGPAGPRKPVFAGPNSRIGSPQAMKLVRLGSATFQQR